MEEYDTRALHPVGHHRSLPIGRPVASHGTGGELPSDRKRPVAEGSLRCRERTQRMCSKRRRNPKVAGFIEHGEQTCRDHIVWPRSTSSNTRERAQRLSGDRALVSHSRSRRHLPEVRCLSAASDASIVARWLASPAPSALRVSHPLSGFIPMHPVAVFQATSAPRLHGPSELFPSRSAVVPLGTRCSLAIGRSTTHRTSRRRLQRLRIPLSGEPVGWTRNTAGGPGSRALLQPGVRHSSLRVNVARSRCSPGLFLSEAIQLDRWD